MLEDFIALLRKAEDVFVMGELPTRRSAIWQRQEFVIGGITRNRGVKDDVRSVTVVVSRPSLARGTRGTPKGNCLRGISDLCG